MKEKAIQRNCLFEKDKSKIQDTKNIEKNAPRKFHVGTPPNFNSTGMKLNVKGAETFAENLYKGNFLLMGYSVKWVEVPAKMKKKKDTGIKRVRRILCYQTYILIDKERQLGHCHYPPPNERISLGDLIQTAMQNFSAVFPGVDLPDLVVLVGHNTLPSLSALSCFKSTSKTVDTIRRQLLSISPRQCIEKTLAIKKGQPKTSVLISIRDSSLLAPQGYNRIEDLGNMIGLPTVQITRKQKANMEDCLRDDPDLFEAHAMRDAEISVKFAAALTHLFLPMIESVGGFVFIPPTLASLTGYFVEHVWADEGIKKTDVLGIEKIKERYYNKHNGRKITRSREVNLAPMVENFSMANEAYHGGWNDAYYFGPSPVEKIIDYDFSGAYMMGLASLGMPKWEQLRQSTHIEDFTCGILGGARLSFEFPSSVKFPTLSVKTEEGSLMRPRKGEHIYATATEIDLAKRLGATITIHAGFVVPCDEKIRPFEKVVERGLAMREHFKSIYGEGCSEEKLIKELLNSIYGKTAQGLAKKRVFDSRMGTHKDMPPHWLSNPYIAGYITGIIRSGLGEVMNALPGERTVYTATTDGFLTNATNEEVLSATQGPVCKLMRDTRIRTTNKSQILEVKHQAMQVLVWRRRSGATIKYFGNSSPIIAKAGLKPPIRWSDASDAIITKHYNKKHDCTWIIKKFMRRIANQRYWLRRMAGLYEIYQKSNGIEDYVEIREQKKLGMEYDFGQKPTEIGQQPLKKSQHVCFQTEPWENVNEYQRARDEWACWSTATKTLMKTPSDVERFMSKFNIQPVVGLNRRYNETPIKRCVKTFLRAYMREEMGLSKVKDENEQGRDNSRFLLRTALRAALFAVRRKFPEQSSGIRELLGIKEGATFTEIQSSKKRPGENLIDNASRKNVKLPLHGVPRTPETELLVRSLKSLWVGKGLDEGLFFTP